MSDYTPTIFVDLDGTLIKHQGPPWEDEMVPLAGALAASDKWLRENCKVIIVTGRPEEARERTERGLRALGFNYDYLLMGITSGTRYLINDLKPYDPFTKTAIAVNLRRDEGLLRKAII